MFDKAKERRDMRILQKYGELAVGLQDLTGGAPPSALFCLLSGLLRGSLSLDAETSITPKSVAWRRKAHFIIKTFGPHFLGSPQIIENRCFLKDPLQAIVPDDPGIKLPDSPVIWTSNHGFKDDGLASILAARRHSYLLIASLPQLCNTLDGATAWLNGIVLVNRKVEASRRTVIPKAVRAMQNGADLLIFPEGVWNKSPNALIIDLWPGIWRVARETGAKVVPIVHYIRDYSDKLKNNPIHTVIDDPIRIDDLSEQAALRLIRDVLATWHYLMMEAYGKSTRAEALDGADTPEQAWERQLAARISTVDRYDTEIELCADYRPKGVVRSEDVWRPVAKISHVTAHNAKDVIFARRLVRESEKNDFQRRF